MNEIKDFRLLTWNVSEEEYRADKAISYSKLSDFFKKGPKSLIDKNNEDSPALRNGSLVDCILTAKDELNDRFLIADINKFSEPIRKIVDIIYLKNTGIKLLTECEDESILESINEVNYQPNWKDRTRIDKIIELGSKYFEVLSESNGRTVTSTDEYELANQCVNTLKTHRFTYKEFDKDEDEEIFYQLKLKTNLFGVDVRCMFDEIKINHKLKTIQPNDLKTTGKDEHKFCESFESWNYWIQSGLYSSILRNVISNDEFYHDYKILPFKFIVINKNNLTPLVWIVENQDEVDRDILEKYGVTWIDLLLDVDWHYKNNKFNYSRDSYENNGLLKIQIKK